MVVKSLGFGVKPTASMQPLANHILQITSACFLICKMGTHQLLLGIFVRIAQNNPHYREVSSFQRPRQENYGKGSLTLPSAQLPFLPLSNHQPTCDSILTVPGRCEPCLLASVSWEDTVLEPEEI